MSGDVALIDSGDGAISRLVRTATTLFDTPRFHPTALVGPITFLGLIVAAIAYQISGTGRHSIVMPMAGLLGVGVLLGGQTVLEQLLGQATVLSVVIEFVGGIAFIWLVIRKVRT